MITISTQQYKHLMQLGIDVEKLKRSIDRMKNVIKSKDAKIKELKTTKRGAKSVDLSKLSDVSVFYRILVHQLVHVLINNYY